MLFHSAEFLLAFLPVVFFGYFWLTQRRWIAAAKSWLVIASLVFYAWWNIQYLPLILLSIAVNFAVGSALARRARARGDGGMENPLHPRGGEGRERGGDFSSAGGGRSLSPVLSPALRGRGGQVQSSPLGQDAAGRALLTGGVIFDLGLLAYYKYAGFFLDNTARLLGLSVELPAIVLPLAISFFTFTQIAYLVDSYRGEAREYDLLNYALFVSFFPHLIAGPIVHHREIMPQFADAANWMMRYRNVAAGLILFGIGLTKKVLLADTFGEWARAGFDEAASLNFIEAWAASLSYTFQLYFDFSGYTDMALGAALLFNIRMPINFTSPYQALDIRDFWRRWHMTLSRFLRDYLYIPLGGSANGKARMYPALAVTFVLGGLWHGATWMFVLWGALHGVAVIVHRAWHDLGFRLPAVLAWFLTFNFVNVAWVFFRAHDLDNAFKVLRGMAGMNGIVLPHRLSDQLGWLADYGIQFGIWMNPANGNVYLPLALLAGMLIVLTGRNSNRFAVFAETVRWPAYGRAVAFGSLAGLSLLLILSSKYSEFIYFNF